MADIGRGLAGFAEGFASGFEKYSRMKAEKEERDLRMTKIRDEAAMNADIKKLNDTTVKPVESYEVRDPEGNSTVYTDPAMAHDASTATPGSEVMKRITVAGKHYDDPEEAAAAAERANSPIAKMRMAGDIAMKYNRPDIAGEYAKAYKVRVDQNRQDVQQTMMDAASTGDTKALINAYNDRLPNGRKAELVEGDNGAVGIQITSKGKPLGAPQMFPDTAALFNTVQEQAMKTPDNALEVWKHSTSLGQSQQGLNLQARGVAVQEATGKAAVAQTEAKTAQMPEELALERRRVGATEMGAKASLTSAGASVLGANAAVTNANTGIYNATTNRQGLTMPKVISGVDPQNQVTLSTTQPVYDDSTKQWGLNVSPPQTIKDMLPTGMAKPPKPDPFGLGTPKPVKTDAQKLQELKALFPQPGTK